MVQEFSFITPVVSDIVNGNVSRTVATDYSRIENVEVEVFGIQPNFFETAEKDYLVIDSAGESALTLGE